MKAYQQGKIQEISGSLEPIVRADIEFYNIDLKSRWRKSQYEKKDYKIKERNDIYNAFQNIVDEIKKLSFFNYPDKLSKLKHNLSELNGIIAVAAKIGKMIVLIQKTWLDLNLYFNGLTLKEIDFTQAHDVKRSKMRKIGGKMWADEFLTISEVTGCWQPHAR